MTVDGHRSSGSLPPQGRDLADYPADEAGEYPDYPDYPESEDVEPPDVAGGPAYQSGNSVDPDGDLLPDDSAIQLRRELRRLTNPVPPAGPIAGRGRSGQPGGPGSSPASAAPGQPRTPGPSGSGRAGDSGPGQAGVAPALSHRPPSGGRHARREGPARHPRLDYVPRHAVRTPGPGSVSPTEITEVFSRVRQDPTERPMASRPESAPIQVSEPVEPVSGPPAGATATKDALKAADAPPSGKRERVVLSQRKGRTRPVRTVVDVQELTQVGEVLSTSLIRSQLALALRLGGIGLITLGSLPAMFVIFPVLGRFELFGLRLPWLLLGVLAYPFLVALGWMYSRSAERLEQVFADHIQS